jgi:osmotically inducible protein OsmC
MPTRNASARWEGGFKQGGGTMKLGSGAYEGPYSAQSRFEDGDGTNPEELIGAAHAGCFSMALALMLGDAGHEPDSIETDAAVHIDPAEGGGFEISRIELSTRARVPGLDDDEFQRVAAQAKEGCPVSKALTGADISLEASLEA